jgi:hypothetical protein
MGRACVVSGHAAPSFGRPVDAVATGFLSPAFVARDAIGPRPSFRSSGSPAFARKATVLTCVRMD